MVKPPGLALTLGTLLASPAFAHPPATVVITQQPTVTFYQTQTTTYFVPVQQQIVTYQQAPVFFVPAPAVVVRPVNVNIIRRPLLDRIFRPRVTLY